MVVGDIAVGTEVLVIGAGPGGYVAAIRAAQLGKDVTLIDKNELGGVCLQEGCIPSKALIYASDFYAKIKSASKMGINVENASIDIKGLMSWKNSIIKRLTLGVGELCKANKITVIKGNARFESSKKVRITSGDETKNIEFEYAIIATGSKPSELPGFKIDEKKIISSTGALSLDKIPKSLIVIGGGYIGLELGSVYARLGTKVTMLEYGPSIISGNDPELVEVVRKHAEGFGIDIYLNTKAEKWEEKKDKVVIYVDSKDKGKFTIEGDKILLAVGRKPNLDSLGLENTKVKLNDKGFIKVDTLMKTEDSRIYAIGDVVPGPMLAHKATREGKVAAEVICGQKSAFDNLSIPLVIFTEPEIASVGLSEAEAKKRGINIKVGKFPFRASGRALTVNETDGFVKIVAKAENNQVIGVQIVGSHASDLISEASLAIEMGARLEDLAATIHPHPTLPESLMEAAEAAMGKAIHIFETK